MSNRTQLRVRLREELGDTGAVRIWSDDLLDSLLIESVGWYSRLWPLQATAYRQVAEGQREFDVPSGALSVTGVECPPGLPLPQEANGSVGPWQGGARRQTWSAWGSTLYLGTPASGAEVGAQKLIMRVLLPWDRLDPVEDWPGPENDERLLVLWSATEAWAWLEGYDRKRGRHKEAGETARRYAEQLEKEVSARRRAAGSRQLEVG